MLDFIGIGSLNVDYIAPREPLIELRKPLDVGQGPITLGNPEDFVSDERTRNLIATQGSANFVAIAPGGSTFNVLKTICGLGLGLRTGYVGIVGLPEGQAFLDRFREWHVDQSYVFSETAEPGRCIAVIDDDTKERRLTTSEGVNRFLTDRIKATKQTSPSGGGSGTADITHYLASARWIHITSFHNLPTLTFFVDRLKAAKELNPGLTVSFDPGHQHTLHEEPPVTEMYRIADLIFVSEREFLQLARVAPHVRSSPEAIAHGIFERTGKATQIVVLKRRSSIQLIRWVLDELSLSTFWHRALPKFRIRDDVGAGDVFAGGFIAAYLVPAFEGFGRGPSKLGSALVRAKLQAYGDEGYDGFHRIALEQLATGRRARTRSLRDRISLRAPLLGSWLAGIVTGVAGSVIVEALRSLVSGR